MGRLEEFFNSKPVNYDQIPEIDLYMDQVLSFLDEKLESFKRNDDDKILTKTMINNYVKDKLISPPVKKKYNQDQISYLNVIYKLKNAFSIKDIKTLFELIDSEKVESQYNEYINVEQEKLAELSEKYIEMMEDRKNLKKYVLELIVETSLKTKLVEYIIDEIISEKAEKAESIDDK